MSLKGALLLPEVWLVSVRGALATWRVGVVSLEGALFLRGSGGGVYRRHHLHAGGGVGPPDQREG